MRLIDSNSVLSKRNSLAYYRGCTNLCISCPSRSRCAGQKKFTDIGVKYQGIELLDMALRHKRKKLMIHTSTIADPYQSIEKEFELYRKTIELLIKKEFGFSITTKSNLILRDIDLLNRLNYETKCVLNLNIPTSNSDKLKLLEPLSMSLEERLNLIDLFVNINIPVIVHIKPIIPFINDDISEFKQLLNILRVKDIKGVYLTHFGTKMKVNSKLYFFEQLQKKNLHFYNKIRAKYNNQFTFESPYAEELNSLYLEFIKERDNLIHDPLEVRYFNNKYENRSQGKQLRFF